MPLLDQQLRGLLSIRRKVQVRRLTGSVIAQIALPIGPARGPAGAQENDRAGGNGAVGFLKGADVRGGQPVVGISRGLLGYVENDSRRDELRQRDLVCRPAVLREMRRGVQMRAAVLGRAE